MRRVVRHSDLNLVRLWGCTNAGRIKSKTRRPSAADGTTSRPDVTASAPRPVRRSLQLPKWPRCGRHGRDETEKGRRPSFSHGGVCAHGRPLYSAVVISLARVVALKTWSRFLPFLLGLSFAFTLLHFRPLFRANSCPSSHFSYVFFFPVFILTRRAGP